MPEPLAPLEALPMTDLRQFPLICGFSERIIGLDFVVVVRAQGRILVEREEEGWWASGVNPGALAEGGHSLEEAVHNLRRRFLGVLFDIAQEAPDFDSFKQQVERFFFDTDEWSKNEWESARTKVRAARLAGAENLPDLPTVEDAAPPTLEVRLLQRMLPSVNEIEKSPALAA